MGRFSLWFAWAVLARGPFWHRPVDTGDTDRLHITSHREQLVLYTFALSSVRVQFIADTASALEATQRVDTFVMTAVRVRRTFIELCIIAALIYVLTVILYSSSPAAACFV